MDEQIARTTIKQMIERREKRLDVLKSTYPRDLETIGKIEHGIMTLIEAEHNLRLCDCPDEAYAVEQVGTLKYGYEEWVRGLPPMPAPPDSN